MKNQAGRKRLEERKELVVDYSGAIGRKNHGQIWCSPGDFCWMFLLCGRMSTAWYSPLSPSIAHGKYFNWLGKFPHHCHEVGPNFSRERSSTEGEGRQKVTEDERTLKV